MKSIVFSALIAAGFLAVTSPAAQAGGIQIKGISSTMTLGEALEAVQNRGGACQPVEASQFSTNKNEVSHSCWMPLDHSDNDRTTNILLNSVNTGSVLVLERISFDCRLTNTCGMSALEIAQALQNAGIIGKVELEKGFNGRSLSRYYIGTNHGRVAVFSADGNSGSSDWSISVSVPRDLTGNASFN